MHITTYHLIGGARNARGLTVIIDVFRAFSLECWLFDRGVTEIFPVGSVALAEELKAEDPSLLLCGERKGKKCPGFDFGNSPSEIEHLDLTGRRAVHTTSAGTQGIANAAGADAILTGSLVNAAAIADYIRRQDPEEVSLVCMGFAGKEIAEEDELAAEYITALLEGRTIPDLKARAEALRFTGGRRFFDPAQASVYPEKDFWRCIEIDRFPFVIRVENAGTRGGELLHRAVRIDPADF